MPEHTEIRLIDIYTTVVRTETKVNAIEAQLPDHEARLRALTDAMPPQLEARLLSLERFRWALMGAGIAAGGVSGWVTNVLLHR